MMEPIISAIVVTHNSEEVLGRCLGALSDQVGCLLSIIVVDSGSNDTVYLENVQKKYHFELIKTTNVGYSRANNLGYSLVRPDAMMVVFLNPDTFLPPDYLLNAFRLLEKDVKVAVISGVLEGYDNEQGKPAGCVDSTGVFRTWYGRWYDRDHGRDFAKLKRERQYLPAICGALMACRKDALTSMGSQVFDPDFFLYKEDIELSIRIKKSGWKLLFEPELHAWHGRGWNRKREAVPYSLRLTAARSEILLCRKHPSPYLVWALLKFLLVRIFRL